MSACLTAEDLERLVSERLTDEEDAVFHAHIESCPRCAESLAALRRDESMLHLLRTEASDETHSVQANDGPPPPRPGRAAAAYPKIEGYRIVGVLGQGGMGIVYRAVQAKLSRTVALKVLPAVVGTANPAAVERFKREATAAAQLHHTNIVPIYDFGESSDAYYYAMELIEGQPLDVVIKRLSAQDAPASSPVQFAQLLKESTATADDFQIVVADARGASAGSGSGTTSGASSTGRGRAYYRQVAHWMADAAEALQFAHDQHIIHRDIKPANFLITMDHRIMVADFGLAKSAGEHSVTMTGSLIGTLRYMSPEQAMAKRVRLDHRTDIYSLGVTMYELLTFQPAFPGKDEKEILGSIIAREPISARKIDPHVPRELETICFKAMEKLPDARYDTARAMGEDLRRWSNDEPIQARRPSPFQRASKFTRRHSAVFLTASVVLIGAVMLSLGLRAYHGARARNLAVQADVALKKKDYKNADRLAWLAFQLRPGDLQIKKTYDTARAMWMPLSRIRESPDRDWVRENLPKGGLAIDVPEDPTAEAFTSVGIQAMEQKDFSRAEEFFGQALQIEPDNFRALGNYAILKKEVYRHQTRAERDRGVLLDSLALYERALSLIKESDIRPDRLAMFYNAYSASLLMAGRLTEAERSARKAIALNPENYSAWSNLAKVLTLEVRIQDAFESAAEGARLAGRDRVDYWAGPVWRSLGTFQLFRGDDQAIGSLETSLFHRPEEAGTLRMVSRAFLTLEPSTVAPRALDMARKADQLKEKEPKNKRVLALALLRNERWPESIDAAEAAIALGDMPTINHLIQAVAYARQGQLDSAREQIEAANSEWPGDLSDERDVTWTVEVGVIWFDTADELIALRDEAESLIRAAEPPP